MPLVESPSHLKRKTGRPRGRPVGSSLPGLADRLKRYQMQERFAELLDKHGHAFAEEVLTAKDENGDWKYAFSDRLVVFKECLDRAYGRAPVSLQVDQSVQEAAITKVVHTVRWLPPDPNDRSRVIEPEPDY